jgi:hypothetical protein
MYIFKNFPGEKTPTQGEAASNAGRDGGWKGRRGEETEGEVGRGKGLGTPQNLCAAYAHVSVLGPSLYLDALEDCLFKSLALGPSPCKHAQ